MRTRLTPLLPVLALAACTLTAPAGDGVAPLTRLTPEEHANTVRDLFGASAVMAWAETGAVDEDLVEGLFPIKLPDDAPVHGFRGLAEGQVASAYLIESYQAAAKAYAPMVRLSSEVWLCDGVSTLDEAAQDRCGQQSMVRLAQRAWRRPVTEAEQTRLEALWSALRVERNPVQALEGVAEALLQTPAFLYRTPDATSVSRPEAGKTPLSDWEVASRLSYALWDSMPDEALFAAAAAGELDTARGVARQARRMLRDPKARDAVVRFHRQWLNLDAVFGVRVNLDAYAPRYAQPVFDAWEADLDGEEAFNRQDMEEAWSSTLIGFRRAMSMEADRFVAQEIFEGPGRLSDLFTSHRGFITELEAFEAQVTTADLHPGATVNRAVKAERLEFDDGNLGYSLALRPATFDPATRAGILTLPAFMAVNSHPVHPAPILRGVRMLEAVACEDIGQPPAAALSVEVPDQADAEGTNRSRLEATTASPGCAACHSRINPLGFAFEHYDTLGGYRTEDHGQPVDASGSWKPRTGPEVAFRDAVDLSHQLAEHPAIQDCYARQWTRYLLGADVAADDPLLAAVQAHFRDTRGDILDLIVTVVASDAFRHRPTP